MKVCLDLSPAVQDHAGLGRYAEEMARALLELRDGCEVRIFYTDSRGRKPAPPLDALPHVSMRWPNKPWRMSALVCSYTHFPMDSVAGDADVFHATDHLLPYLRRIPSVFTLHDLIPLERPAAHLPLNRWYLQLMLPRFLRRADAIICVSQHTRNDAIRFFKEIESKIHVIPEGVNSCFRPVQDPGALAEVRARYDLPERFILFVGTIEPRKNLETLWEAYKALRSQGRTEKLVVVGRKGWLYQPTLARLRDLGLEDEVLFSGYVANSDLPAIYALATCFVFPSLYEGFGLPPLEAMACGCPVVCSNSSSLPEVCGDAAILVAPKDVSALTSALRRLLEDAALREDLRARGLRQAARFTWDDAARKTLGVYRAVVEHGRNLLS